MQPLRRWVPGPAAIVARDYIQANDQQPDDVAEKDLIFCAELASHGGVASSVLGFKAEGELVRMRQAGLLNLQREPDSPFAVIRVTLSSAARELLSKQAWNKLVRVATRNQTIPAAAVDFQQAKSARRNGFEEARGMIGAAVKAECGVWIANGGPPGMNEFEARIMTRIGQIDVPFLA